MPSSLASSTSETARLTSAMSSRVTPWSRSTTTRTTLRRPGGGDHELLQVVAGGRRRPGRSSPVSRAVAGSGRWVPREADTGFLLQARRPRGAVRTPLRPAPRGLRRWSGPGRGEGVRLPPGRSRRDRAPGYEPAPAPRDGRGARATTGRRPATRPASAHIRLQAVRAERMGAMSPSPATPPPGFSRRTLLAASAAGLALLAAGCSSPPVDEREKVTSAAGRRARGAGRGPEVAGRGVRGGRQRPTPRWARRWPEQASQAQASSWIG